MLRWCLLLALISLVNAEKSQDSKLKAHGYAISLVSLLPLLEIKVQSVRNLESYVGVLKKQLGQVELALKHMEHLLGDANTKLDLYATNWFYRFTLMRHMHVDSAKWLELMRAPLGSEQIAFAQHLRAQLPTPTDYSEALEAMDRLQTTYKLNATDMAEGILRGRHYSRKTWSALECAVLGLQHYGQQHYELAEHWLTLALYYYKAHSTTKVLELLGWKYVNILELLVKVNRKLGRYEEALLHAYEGLSLEFEHAFMWHQVVEMEQLNQLPFIPPPAVEEPENYKTVCRQEYAPLVNGVHCRYLRSTPFLQLAPIKMELLLQQPPVAYYHGLLSDKEITSLIHLAQPQLQRSEFYDTERQGSIQDYSGERTCKTTRLLDGRHELTRALNRRIADVSALSLTDAEQLQFINYGISGHILEHTDYSNQSSGGQWESGDRTATALIYLTDVEQGGETLFPFYQLRVAPRKGSILLFYNLKLNSQPDWSTLHISCPIIFGNKWIATKWIRDKAQMFIRRCPLKFNPLSQ